MRTKRRLLQKGMFLMANSRKDLPEKIEENVFARLDGEQMQLYDAYATSRIF